MAGLVLLHEGVQPAALESVFVLGKPVLSGD